LGAFSNRGVVAIPQQLVATLAADNRRTTKMECEEFLEPVEDEEYDDDL